MNFKGVSAMSYFKKKTLTYCHLILLVSMWLQVPEAYSETKIAGKVVHVADGDTITVLQKNQEYKIRLYGIDTPEKKQDFGAKAKAFTSDLVSQKEVAVIQKDVDRYGRVVGMVYIGKTCINEEIVKAGFAWVYQHYCKEPFCKDWIKLETQAREKGKGLWSHPNPVPPWDFRKNKRKQGSD